MSNKFLLVTGGTGGHVLPAQNFANYLVNKNIDTNILIDKRGFKYLNNFDGKIHTVHSSNLNGNLFSKIFGLGSLLIGFVQSFIVILIMRPTVVISFGSYASFFPILSCIILKPFYKTDIFIHEQNSVLGRTNKLFLYFAKKLFLNFKISSKIKYKYQHKTYVVGFPEKINRNVKIKKQKSNTGIFTIFIFGGSQASEFISNFSINLMKSIDKDNIIDAKFIIQCPKSMIEKVSINFKKSKFEFIVNNFFNNIDEILLDSSLAISRAGAGSVSDLINFKIPSILIPLPTAKDNHQYHNAYMLSKHNLAIILKQNMNEIKKAKEYVYEIYNRRNILESINKEFDKIKVKNSNSLIYKLVTNEKKS